MIRLSVALLIALWALPCQASLLDAFGLGGATSGRVSSVTAEERTPFAAAYNPALLSAAPETLFSFSTFGNFSRFNSLGDVRLADTRFAVPAESAPLAAYAPPSTSLANWAVGFVYPFSTGRWGARRAGIGITASGPFEKLRTFVASTPYDFYSLRYGTSDAQFKSSIASSVEIWRDTLYVGAGLSLYLSAAGNADATIVGQNPTSRLAFDVSLNTAAQMGLFAKFGDTRGSLVYRQAVNPSFEQKVLGRVQWGTRDVVTQPFTIKTTLYYEPRSVDSDWQRRWTDTTISVGASFQFWKEYQPPFLITEAVDSEGNTRRTEQPNLDFSNTLSPRVSLTQHFGPNWELSAGYQYRPTPVKDLSGPTNSLDSDAHVLGISFSHSLTASDWMPLGFRWSLFAQHHWLQTREVKKAQNTTLGGPGYTLSGRAYSIGLNLSTAL